MTIREELRSYLDKSMTKFENVVSKLGEDDLNTRIQDKEDGWTIIETLRHIANAERGLINVIQSILEGHEGSSVDFDLERFNTSSNEKMRDIGIDELVSNMRKYRDKTIATLESVKDDQWMLEGRHPNQKFYTIKKHFEIISWHQRHHLKGITERLGDNQ